MYNRILRNLAKKFDIWSKSCSGRSLDKKEKNAIFYTHFFVTSNEEDISPFHLSYP